MDEFPPHKDFIVWQKSMQLVMEVYRLTAQFPTQELEGVTLQARRAAISIAANIAEGRRRGTRKSFCYFLFVSFGSAAELETYLDAAKDLNWAHPDTFQKSASLLDEIMHALNDMTRGIRFDEDTPVGATHGTVNGKSASMRHAKFTRTTSPSE